MLVASCMPLLAVAGTSQNEFQAITPVPRSADAPGSSDQSGDEWPMFHSALNHTGVATTTSVKWAGPLWNYTTGYVVESSPAVASCG